MKIEPDPDHPVMLLTVRGFGYKLTPGTPPRMNTEPTTEAPEELLS